MKVCMHLCAERFACVCPLVNRGQRLTSAISCSPPCLWEQGLSLNPELIISARLSGHSSPRICLSLPPRLEVADDCDHTQLLCGSFRSEHRSSCLYFYPRSHLTSLMGFGFALGRVSLCSHDWLLTPRDPVASASPCAGIKDVHCLNCLVFVLKSVLSGLPSAGNAPS